MQIKSFTFPRQAIFTKGQFDRLSNIFDGAGQVGLGTAILGPTFTITPTSINLAILIQGFIAILGVWFVSILLAKWGGE